MDRQSLTTIATGLVSVFTMLGFVAAVPGSPTPRSRPEGGWRLLPPVTYENISVFPVVTPTTLDTSAFLTLDEGLSSGEVLVSEQGATGLARTRETRGLPQYNTQYSTGASVNQLVLINRSKRPLILLAGELVSGGKQDRIIAKDRIVAPGSEPLPLDVFCVEHGRWSSGSQFAAAKTIVHPSVREQAAVKQSQTDVWAAVTSGTTAAAPAQSGAAVGGLAAPRISADSMAETLRTEAPTQSYDKIYTSHRVGRSIDTFVDEVQRRFARATSGLKGERVVGVVIAYGGEVAWSDIFASADLFQQYWPKLLRSYAVEALARPTLRETASTEDAQEFLGRLQGREVQESEPGVYRWREITQGPLSLIELDALDPKPVTLHRLLLHRTS
jgi:hypothetical protein